MPQTATASQARATRPMAAGGARARRKFLRYFPAGFRDETYIDWERSYKWQTHLRWEQALGKVELARLIAVEDFAEVAARAVRVEQQSRHSMIFSFEKMALRDAVRTPQGARGFALGLDRLLHGEQGLEARFTQWIEVVAALPRRQTPVLTWPLVTVFGFIAQPRLHLFVKPTVMRAAAKAYGVDLDYESRPSWRVYRGMLDFAAVVRREQRELRPRDMIDIQSFLWVQGSDEYP